MSNHTLPSGTQIYAFDLYSFLMAIIASAYAFNQTSKAEEQADIATSQRLAAEANSLSQEFPQLKLLLAVESIKAASKVKVSVPSATKALLNAMADIGGYGLSGHESKISSVAISPDNHWLVTGSSDTTARLWNLTAKDTLKTAIVLSGHENEISSVMISPNSQWLVTRDSDTTALLWDLAAQDPTKTAIVLGLNIYAAQLVQIITGW